MMSTQHSVGGQWTCKAASAAIGGLVLAAAGGCTVPADTTHVVYGAVTNQCGTPLRVVVTQFADDIALDTKPETLKLVQPGARVEFSNPMYRPLQPDVYLWVARDGASVVSAPLAIPVEAMEASAAPGDDGVIDVVVSGDMCPG